MEDKEKVQSVARVTTDGKPGLAIVELGGDESPVLNQIIDLNPNAEINICIPPQYIYFGICIGKK